MLPRACDVKRSICTGSLPLIVAKPIKPLMMVVQRAAFVRLAPKSLALGAVNASEVAMMHATAYRRSIFQLFAARARRAEQLVKHTSSSRHRRQDMVYHAHCQRPLARAPTDLVGTKFGGCRTSAMAAARKVAPRACSALIPVQHPSTPRLLFPCAFLNILFHNGLNKYLVDSYCTGGVSRTRITRTTPRCCYTRFLRFLS